MSSSVTDHLVAVNSALTRLSRRIRRIDADQGVGRARLSALAVLHFGGSCSVSELARAEMVSRVTMHHVVNGLENEGLVRRQADHTDRRRQSISLTREGRATIRRAHRARIDYLRTLLTDVSVEELEITARTLTRMRDNARYASVDGSNRTHGRSRR